MCTYYGTMNRCTKVYSGTNDKNYDDVHDIVTSSMTDKVIPDVQRGTLARDGARHANRTVNTNVSELSRIAHDAKNKVREPRLDRCNSQRERYQTALPNCIG